MALLPDEQLADGAAEQETDGYFDVDNLPPWDSWVAWVDPTTAGSTSDKALIAYVPEVFVTTVARGIWVNPESA